MLSIWTSFNPFSLNIFILHRLRNKFLQLILISLDSASWELHQYTCWMSGPMKIPKLTPALGNQTQDLMIARLTIYLMTTDTTKNPLPHDKILSFSKLKACAEDNLNVAKTVQIFCNRVENVVGKGENAGYQHFLLFSQCFQKASISESWNTGIVWERVKSFVW